MRPCLKKQRTKNTTTSLLLRYLLNIVLCEFEPWKRGCRDLQPKVNLSTLTLTANLQNRHFYTDFTDEKTVAFLFKKQKQKLNSVTSQSGWQQKLEHTKQTEKSWLSKLSAEAVNGLGGWVY